MLTFDMIKNYLTVGTIAFEYNKDNKKKELTSELHLIGNAIWMEFFVTFDNTYYYSGFNINDAIDEYNNINFVSLYTYQQNLIINNETKLIEASIINDAFFCSFIFRTTLLQMNELDAIKYLQIVYPDNPNKLYFAIKGYEFMHDIITSSDYNDYNYSYIYVTGDVVAISLN